MSKLKELREQRAQIHAAIAVELAKEQTPEIRTKVASMYADIDAKGVDIANIERSEALEAETRAAATGTAAPATKTIAGIPTDAEGKKAWMANYTRAWNDAMKNGRGNGQGAAGMSDESRKLLYSKEARALAEGSLLSQVGTYTGLGYFVPEGFVYNVEQAEKYFCPFLDNGVCTVIQTASGQPLPFPTSDDTSQVATLIAENQGVTEKDVTANHISLGAYKLTSGLVQVSIELLQDSAFNLEAWLTARFAERFGRGLEGILTNGNGINGPTGLLTAIAASGSIPVVAIGSSSNTGGTETGANSIGSKDLVTLEHSVDPIYRRNGKYMFHDQTLAYLRNLLDKFGRPLWQPGVSEKAPDLINGRPYVINQAMPQIGASNTTVIFGDFSKYYIRRVKDLAVLRLDERYAEQGIVAFVSFARIDADEIDAGQHPLNTLGQHS